MSEVNLKELESKSEESWNFFQSKEKDFKDYLIKNPMSSLPDGFDIRIGLDRSYRKGSFELSLKVEDNNRMEGEGRPKYFWAGDEASFKMIYSEDKIDYHANATSGGYNSHHYGNSKLPEISQIEIHEMMIDIRTAIVGLMKEIENSPEKIIDLVNDYFEAKRKHTQIRTIINSENKRLESIEKEKNLEIIKEKFQTIPSYKINEVIENLTNNTEHYNEQSFIKMRVGHEDLTFSKVDIKCLKGGKTTYKVKVPTRDEDKSIKKSDLQEFVSDIVFLDGQALSSIEEVLNSINNENLNNEFEDNYSYSKNERYSLNIKEVAEILSSKDNISNFLSSKEENKQTKTSKFKR